MTILEALKTAVAAHTKPSLVVSVGQILLVVFFVAGCTTPIERAELSKGPLEQRFGPSNNRIDFPCSFGFQSSVLEYQKSMVQGQWWVGVCIIDLDKNSLYFGAPSPSDPRNLLKMSLHSADLKEYGSFSIIDRNRSLLSQAFGTRSAYPDSQLVLATRARLQRSNNAGIHNPSYRDAAVLVKETRISLGFEQWEDFSRLWRAAIDGISKDIDYHDPAIPEKRELSFSEDDRTKHQKSIALCR